ncbi:MAG: HEAT repeat domain-containing protein [Deltaproteobacteria bacterium]|nr:HEAT repeat domain-containing protein [Deltaproteobacteria bacterium]
MKRFNKALILCAALSFAACSGETGGETRGGAGGKADSVGGAWLERVEADVAQLKKDDPKLWRILSTAEGMPTRAGFLRLRGKNVNKSVAASVFLTRYLEERDAGKRVAFIDALPRTGGQYEDAIVELMDSENDDTVRSFMVAVMGDGKTAASVQGIRKGFADKSIKVRTEAAVAASRNDAGVQLAAELQTALSDDSSAVRAAAARALGVHKVDGAKATLAQRLSDADGTVRLQAVLALSRIDRGFLAAQPDLARLAQDEDLRVRKAVAAKVTRADR